MTPPPDPAPTPHAHRPGSPGERHLQATAGTARRAEAFYNHQMLDRLNGRMQEFITAREMVFLSTADAVGNCDCSVRTGPPGFFHVLDERTLAYPEYRGNGVMASLGNILENPHIGLLFVDFSGSTLGCHVNGRARVLENDEVTRAADGDDAAAAAWGRVVQEALTAPHPGRKPERWVLVRVEEAYIHCSKHIPLLIPGDKSIPWGTDDPVAKGGDFFAVRDLPRPWRKPDGAAGGPG